MRKKRAPLKGNPRIIYSIYQFVDPRTGKPVYVGLTSNLESRFKHHISPRGVLYPLAQELKLKGMKLTPDVLETTESSEEAKRLEKKWIQAKAPLLNQIHNQNEIERRKREEEISSWMKWTGWTHHEADLYLAYFHSEGGYTYDAIEYAVNASRKLLGIDGSFTQSEILHIALKYRGIEVQG